MTTPEHGSIAYAEALRDDGSYAEAHYVVGPGVSQWFRSQCGRLLRRMPPPDSQCVDRVRDGWWTQLAQPSAGAWLRGRRAVPAPNSDEFAMQEIAFYLLAAAWVPQAAQAVYRERAFNVMERLDPNFR